MLLNGGDYRYCKSGFTDVGVSKLSKATAKMCHLPDEHGDCEWVADEFQRREQERGRTGEIDHF